ncbi:MAG: hypothetical protein ACR2J8_11875 [Thermomicrobiales bacterium]
MRIVRETAPPPPPPQVIVHRYSRADPDKSYTRWAWVTLGLYCLFYIPGLISNIIFWRSSVRYQKETGVQAPGAGCLVLLLWVVGIGIPILLLIGSANPSTK